jgi:hypothetical protein
MSLLTIRKRIALVAVTALTAGILTVATSPVANAAAGDLIAELTGQTGTCSTVQSSTFGATTGQIRSTLAAPVTVTVAVGGSVAVSKPTPGTDSWMTWSSNGVISSATAGTLHGNYGVYAFETTTSTSTWTFTAASVGTATIKTYNTAAPYSAVNTPASTSVQASQINVVVVATCAGTSYSSTYSAVQVEATYNATPSNTAGDVLTYGSGAKAYINIVGKNGYNVALPAGTTWAVQATNGAKVSIGTSTAIDDTTTANGLNSFASAAAAGTNISIRVAAPSAAALTTTVTVTADGAAVATKEISFVAEPAKLTIVKQLTGLIGGEGAFLYTLTDAAGKAVNGEVSGRSTSYTSRVTSVTSIKGATLVASDMSPLNNETINTVDSATVLGTSASSTSAYGVAKFACSSATTTGSSPITLRFTTPVGEVDVDTVVDLKCAKGLDTYTVSADKATYKVGEIATFTITAKDSSGAAVNDFTALADDKLAVGGGTPVVNTKATDYFSGGVKTYQAQMTTAGAFNVVVTLSGTVTKSATTPYTVTSGDVSNAQVLQSIVALIASINKQIQALQKLILKR